VIGTPKSSGECPELEEVETMSPNITTTRRIAAAIAACVALDVLWVRAPFLIIVAVPFAVVAWRYRGQHVVSAVGVIAVSALYAFLGISYAMSNGLHPAEPHEAAHLISVGDFAFVYIGTPLAVALAVLAVRTGLLRRTRLEGAMA
jgi:hypothetical protein